MNIKRQSEIASRCARRSEKHSHRPLANCWRAAACRLLYWKRNLDDATIARFQHELGAMGYKFQFITLAGFHALNYSMFDFAHGYAQKNMTAFVDLQEREFAAEERGFTAVKHQREVGTSYFDEIAQVVQAGRSSLTALQGSTEDEQFFGHGKRPELRVAT